MAKQWPITGVTPDNAQPGPDKPNNPRVIIENRPERPDDEPASPKKRSRSRSRNRKHKDAPSSAPDGGDAHTQPTNARATNEPSEISADGETHELRLH